MQLKNSPMRNIKLSGQLGKKYGKLHRLCLDGNTTAEAVRAIGSRRPGFTADLIQSKDRGIAYAVFVGKRNITEDELTHPVGNEDIRIVPVILGSKNGGVFNIILGAVLVAASFIPFLAPIAPYLLSTGVAMIAGGVTQLLSPIPKGAKGRDAPENAPSYVFNGAVNTQAQGNPVPLLYGRMIVGSAVISAGINAEDYAPATAGVNSGTPNWNPQTPYDDAPETT